MEPRPRHDVEVECCYRATLWKGMPGSRAVLIKICQVKSLSSSLFTRLCSVLTCTSTHPLACVELCLTAALDPPPRCSCIQGGVGLELPIISYAPPPALSRPSPPNPPHPRTCIWLKPGAFEPPGSLRPQFAAGNFVVDQKCVEGQNLLEKLDFSLGTAYGWTGHKPGSGLSDQPRGVLGVFASSDRL
jgi:hypothetical protein